MGQYWPSYESKMERDSMTRIKKLFPLKELIFELAILYVMYAIDPGHDDLWQPKKACKPHSCI